MSKLSFFFRLFFLLSPFLLFIACNKANDLPVEPNFTDTTEQIIIDKIDNISWGSVKVKINNSFSSAEKMGLIWSDTQIEPTLGEFRIDVKKNNRTITKVVEGFNPQTIYCIRAYVIQKGETFYSKAESFETPKKPKNIDVEK